jgi:cell division protease FtsH
MVLPNHTAKKTAELIDEEISKIIEEQYQRAIHLLIEHKDKLTELAKVLLDKEVIFKDNLQKIFGDRPFDKSKSEALIAEKKVEEKKSPTVEQEDTVE